jgi:hypothetical protein
MPSNRPREVTGTIVGDMSSKSVDTLAHVVFSLPNFHNCHGESISRGNQSWVGRVAFSGGGWRVTLDALWARKTLADAAASRGGYSMGHVGKLPRGRPVDTRLPHLRHGCPRHRDVRQSPGCARLQSAWFVVYPVRVASITFRRGLVWGSVWRGYLPLGLPWLLLQRASRLPPCANTHRTPPGTK